MLKRIVLIALLPLSGCAGSNIETTARYTVEAKAVTEANTVAADLSREKIRAVKAIRLAEIAAGRDVSMKKLETMTNNQHKDVPVAVNASHCEKYRDEHPSLFGACLDDAINSSRRLPDQGATGLNITGDHNTVITGSSGVDIKQGAGGDKGSPITAALISGINKNPFAPIPKQSVDQSGPLLKLGETVVKTGAMLFGANMLFDVLQTGAAKDSVSIEGDYVSNSNNPTTSTEYAPPVEP